MSKTVDKKVVEMSFDNRNFERNVKTSLSTIDKLKSSLNFSGMTKGLDELSASANRVSFNPLTKGIEQVGLQFNALYSIADQSMRRITNSVMDFGLNLGRKLIIDPKKSGFEEYELKMGSIQTIMASTGESLEKVNEYLEELNEYSDKTIYSFQDMTSNIGKFTNAGVDLKDAVDAIKGVSNEAALAGANANEASHAMYNFAQALSSGYVKLTDWKSIEIANMATKDFKNELIQTAVEVGTLTDIGDNMYKTLEGKTLNAVRGFNESLQDQWLTTAVLTGTLKKYSSEETILGQKAIAAAQDVKTFSMLIDTLTEAVQSGWAQSFQIIFGDFNQAKKLWTGASNALGAVIDGVATIRNKYLNSFLGKTFTKTFDAMSEAFSSVKESTDGLKDAVKTVADYANVVDEIINGIWGNGQARWDKLSEAGYDWAHAQNLVNERLGVSLRRETSYVESTNSVAEATGKLDEATKDWISNMAEVIKKRDEGQELNESELIFLEEYNQLSEKQKEAINQIVRLSKRLAMPVKELLHNMDDINGRWLLMESFGNIGKTIITIFHAIGKAWVEVFPPKDAGAALFNLTTGFYRLTRIIRDYLGEINDHDGVVSNAENLVKIFKGLFGVIGVVSDSIKGVLTIALQSLGKILGLVIDPSATFLDILGSWGNVLYEATSAARKWIKENVTFKKVTDTIIPAIINLVKKTKEFITTNETVQKVLEIIKRLFDDLKTSLVDFAKQLISSDSIIRKVFGNLFTRLNTWMNGMKNVDNIPMYIITGLLKGITQEGSKVIDYMINLGTNMIMSFRKILHIESPSKEFFKIGKFIMLGLILGIASQAGPLKNLEGDVLGGILNFGTSIKDSITGGFKGIADTLSGIDYSKMFAVGLAGGMMYLTKQINDTVNNVIKLAEGVISPLKSFSKMLDSVSASVKTLTADIGAAKKMDAKTSLIKGIALSMLMIAGAMYIISKIEPDRLLSAATVCGIMIVVLTALYALIDKLSGAGGGISGSVDANAKKATLNIGPIIGMSIALLAMAIALKKLSVIDSYSLLNAIWSLIVVIGAMSVLLAAIGGLSKWLKISGEELSSVSKSLKKVASSLLLMLIVVKLASKISIEEVKQAMYSIGLITAMFAAFILFTKTAGNNADKAAWLLGSLSLSLLLMVGVIKVASMLDKKSITRGMGVVAGVTAIMGILIAFSAKSGEHAAKAAALVGSFSLAMFGLVISMKILSTIPSSGIKKSRDVIVGIGIIFGLLIGMSHFSGENATKAGVMLLMVAGALAMLTAVIYILSTMSVESLAKGTAVITIIGIMFAGLIKSTEKSKDAAKTITGLLIAMGILLGFVIALSTVDPMSLLSATSAIAAIMLSLAALLKSVDKIDKGSIKSLAIVSGILLTTLGIMAFIIMQLAKLDPERALASAGALSMLLVTLSGALATVALVSKVGTKNAATGVALLTIMSATILPILTLLLSQLVKLDPEKSMKMVQSLSLMLLSMTAVLGALTLIGLGGPAATTGIKALLVLIAAFGILLVAFGVINKRWKEASKFLESGIPMLTAIGNAIGSFVGSIIKGFSNQTIALLPKLGKSLSSFMKEASSFFEGSGKIPKDLAIRLGSLSAGVIALTVAEFVSSMGSILSLRFSLAVFGKELSSFMTNLDPFLKGAANIKPGVSKSIKALSEGILALTTAKFLDNIPILGRSSIAKFGEHISELGDGLTKFSKSVSSISNIKTVKAGAQALKYIADAAAEIPNSKGMISWFTGDNDARTFAAGLGSIASGIVGFWDNLNQAGFTEDSYKLVKAGAKSIKQLALVSAEVPNSGGLLAGIVGDNKLSLFSEGFIKIARGISGFVTIFNKNGTTAESLNIVGPACTAIKQLANVSKEVPNAGGLLSGIVGDNDLSAFAENLPELASGLTGFIQGLNDEGLDNTSMPIVTNLIKGMSSLLKTLKGAGLKDTVSMAEQLKKMSSAISDFMSNIATIPDDTLTKSIDKIGQVINFVKGFENLKIEPITNLSSALKKLGNSGIKGLVASFEDQDYKDKLHKAAKAMGNSAIKGVKAKMSKSAGYDLGEYFVRGLANGITDNQYIATNASSKLGKAALQAAKDALKEESPSKATYEMGKFFDLGLVNGIVEYARHVYNASDNVGETAKSGMSDALSKITDVINADSAMTPTITPVLDLSNIESGANRIGSIFDGQNVGINTNINAISSGLNLRNQNAATNGDIVNAIDKLKTTMSEQTPGNTYNLNGISYNDDTPIANAVGDLIRAIEIEGRV